MQTDREISRLLRTSFPESIRARVVQQLERYPDDAPEAKRVRLAVLRLSRGNASDVAYYVESALTDYRDVLHWAEYPDEGYP